MDKVIISRFLDIFQRIRGKSVFANCAYIQPLDYEEVSPKNVLCDNSSKDASTQTFAIFMTYVTPQCPMYLEYFLDFFAVFDYFRAIKNTKSLSIQLIHLSGLSLFHNIIERKYRRG